MHRLQSDRAQSSSIQIKTLAEHKEVLKVFSDLVSSMYGPAGRASMLQNTSGGNLTLTSSSRSLLSGLSVKRAILKLITSACQGHVSMFHDGGLFLMRLATQLVLGGLELNMNPITLSDIFELFLTLILEQMESSKCGLKVPACMSDLNFSSSFVNSILKSKPVCNLSEQNLKHVSRLLIECFLSGVSEDVIQKTDNVFIHSEEGFDVSESFMRNGLLLQAPELSKFRKKDLKLKLCRDEGKAKVKVALVTVSMSGDMDELSGVKYNVFDNVDINVAVMDSLNEFCDVLIGQEVGLVLCQKVIHPELKYRLRERGVVVVDRIGYQPINFMKALTGAQSIQCLEPSTITQDMFGVVDSVSHTIFHGKSYIHLSREGSLVTTLYLCHLHEQHLNELKDVCNTVLISLHHLLYEPFVLPGAGCWQAKLALLLAKKVKAETNNISEEMGCTENQLWVACALFMKCLVQSGTGQSEKYVINCRNGNVYTKLTNNDQFNTSTGVSCSGFELSSVYDKYIEVNVADIQEYMFSKSKALNFDCEREITKEELMVMLSSREIIIDSYSMCRSALQTAILTAVSALRIGQVIEDTS